MYSTHKVSISPDIVKQIKTVYVVYIPVIDKVTQVYNLSNNLD
jgi:hypothetical protein